VRIFFIYLFLILNFGCENREFARFPQPVHEHVQVPALLAPMPIDVPLFVPTQILDTLYLSIRTLPGSPKDERYLGDWRFRAYNIDDQARPLGPVYSGQVGFDGRGALTLPKEMLILPMVILAYNEVLALKNHNISFEIFIPPYCYDQTQWLISPFENAVWDYYFQAAIKRGDAWEPSQVDCGRWLETLYALSLDVDIRNEINQSESNIFRPEILTRAWQENQEFLVATRAPICLSTRRHVGGTMTRGDAIARTAFPWVIDDSVPAYIIPGPPIDLGTNPDFDPIVINANGLVKDICGVSISDLDTSFIKINGQEFTPTRQYFLRDLDFNGTIHEQREIISTLDIDFYNIRLGNGRILNDYEYDDTCALTEVIQLTNLDIIDQEITKNTGAYFSDLFGPGAHNDVIIYKTSTGDAVLDKDDTWVIFYAAGTSFGTIPAPPGQERVISVELIGNRNGSFRDNLILEQLSPESLFVGLASNYTMGDMTINGQQAFLSYSITTWSGESSDSRLEMRRNIADCYEAADVWTRNFFVTRAFQVRHDEDSFHHCCNINKVITPLLAAEMAVQSQCFSNSRSNNKWATSDFGYWSINSSFGSNTNLVINPGWLAPELEYEIYVQSFDQDLFRGPKALARTDHVGQLTAILPTLVEGDRVMIRSGTHCCNNYELIVPCVPEFTEFVGWPGIPYVTPPL
jgi:hypothetical protein